MMPKSIQNVRSGASFLGVVGVILEPFCCNGRAPRLPSASREALRAALELFYGPRCFQFEAQDDSKMEPKRLNNRCENRLDFGWLWKQIVGRFCGDLNMEGPVGIKIERNSILASKSDS